MSSRGPYARSAQTRAAIGRAALEVVREIGHKELTTAEVSRRAGVSDAARFYHFPTRDHVLVEALRTADAEAAEQLEHLADLDDLDITQVPAFVGISTGGPDPVGDLATAMRAHASDHDHPAHAYYREHNATAVHHLAEGVRRQQASGEAHPDLDPDSVARQLLAVWTGLGAQWKIDPSFDLAGELHRAFVRLTGRSAMQAKASIDRFMAES